MEIFHKPWIKDPGGFLNNQESLLKKKSIPGPVSGDDASVVACRWLKKNEAIFSGPRYLADRAPGRVHVSD